MDWRSIIKRATLALMVAGTLLSLSACTGDPVPASGNVGNVELRDLVQGGARLVDVRTTAEFQAGHISGAENVPVDGIAEAVAGWDKSKPVVVYCQTGSRSLNAMGYLTGQGFEHVYNLEQGLAAWDGELAEGEASGPASPASNDGPTMYAFMSDG